MKQRRHPKTPPYPKAWPQPAGQGFWDVQALVRRAIKGTTAIDAVATVPNIVPLLFLRSRAHQSNVFERHLFAAGLMGPEVRTVCEFVKTSGKRAMIGSLDQIEATLAETAGTQIVIKVQHHEVNTICQLLI